MSRLSEDQKKRIRNLLLQGRSVKSTSAELGHHFNTVKKIEEDLRSRGDSVEVSGEVLDDEFAWRDKQQRFEELLKADPTKAHDELMFLMTSKLHERLTTGNKVAYAEISMGYSKMYELTRRYRNEMRGKDDLMVLPEIIRRVGEIEKELRGDVG